MKASYSVIDLTKVTIVSQHGENVLFQMMTEGARLVGKSLLARVLIQNTERRRNLEHEEREEKATRRASLVVGIVMLLVVAGKLSWASTWRPPQRASNGPAIERLRAGVAADDTALSSILAVTPQMPRGPFDVLNEYEQEMTSIDGRLSRDLAQVSESVGLGQISAKESEDLIWKRYQIAMMQFQVLRSRVTITPHSVD